MSIQTLTPKTQTMTSTTPSTMIDRASLPRQISYLVLHVTDMTKALEFYKNVLGYAFSYESANWCEMSMGMTIALKQIDAQSCGTGSCSSTKSTEQTMIVGRNTGLMFNVVDIVKTYETMKSLGVKVQNEILPGCEGNYKFSFEDPFGNSFMAYGKKI